MLLKRLDFGLAAMFFPVLAIVLAVLAGCALSQPHTPTLPPAQPQQVMIPAASPVFNTTIYDGPTGTINYNNVTFKWSGTPSTANPGTYTYSSFLQGYTYAYTPFLPGTERSFEGLPNGSYIFYVKAQDAYGNVETVPATRQFTVSGAVPPQVVQGLPYSHAGGGYLLIGSDVSRIAVGSDGLTIYALDTTNTRLYRSNSAGMDWNDISSALAAAGPWTGLSVAPDDPGLVAVVTGGGREVNVSADGGSSFSATGLSSVLGAGQAVTCLGISPGYGVPGREIAAGAWGGGGSGSLFVNVVTGFSGGWFNAGAGNPGWPPASSGVDSFAIQYSPSFSSDGSLVLLAAGSSQTYIFLGIRDLGSRGITWNPSTGYPVQVGNTGSPLSSASISLPSDYNSANPYARRIFASWNKASSGGICHISEYQVYGLAAPEPIASIAYYGTTRSGKLLAGAARCRDTSGCYQVQTYFTANPTSNSAAWQPSQKAPTGSNSAMVAWSPDGNTAYAGTSGTESAFSHSINNGATWNQ